MFLRGKRISLQLVNDYHLKKTMAHLNEQRITRFTQHGIYPMTFNHMEDYQNDQDGLYLAIIANGINVNHVGNICLYNIHQTFRTAEISLLLWEQGKGYGTEAIELIVKHAFLRMNINRLGAGTAAKNTGCTKVFYKNNFARCGVMSEAYFFDGEYQDVVQMELLKKDYMKNLGGMKND